MRAIVKPAAPQLASNAYGPWAIALGNAVGRFCSFCEKALTYQLLLFHKQMGVLVPTVVLSANDWANLLLLCGDCAASVTNFNPQTPYFWPDTPDAQQCPYLYRKVDNVTITALNPDGDRTIAQVRGSVILVGPSNDVPQQIQTMARNTYALFRLNGRHFNEDAQQPAYTLPYGEYVHSTDARLNLRMDAYDRAVEAAGALVRAIPTLPIGRAYLGNMMAMINLAVNNFGFLSTWQSAVVATLNAAGPRLLPQLISVLTAQPAPPVPLDRKRTASQFDQGLQDADEENLKKRARMEETLRRLIVVR